MEATNGCQAYRYYENALGAPRCDLYGMPVAWDVLELDATQPDLWYDLACGSPTEASSSSTATSTSSGFSIKAALGLSV